MKKDPQEIVAQCKYYARVISRHLDNSMTEDVYHQAFVFLLESGGISFKTELPIQVVLNNARISAMCNDLFVEDTVMVGMKAKRKLHKCDKIQLRKHMRTLGVQNGLLINFCKGSNKLHFVTTKLTDESSKYFLFVMFEASIFISALFYFYLRHFRNIDFSFYFILFLCATLNV